MTDKGALSELSSRLPFPGLAHLEANLPYFHQGAVDQIVGIVQGQGQQERSDAGTSSGEGLAAPPLTVSVWVCCWGGCEGLPLPAAEELRRRLGARLVGLESINLAGPADLARLAGLVPGLTSLGFNMETCASRAFVARLLPRGAAAEAAGVAAPAPMNFARLAGAARGLLRLTLHGSSPTGWDCGPRGAAGDADGSTGGSEDGWPSLVPLRGLTKLSLARDWGPAPLPLAPLAHPAGDALGASLVELTVERRLLAAAGELEVIGGLTALTLLTLALQVEPQQLGVSVREDEDRGAAAARPPALTRRAFMAGGMLRSHGAGRSDGGAGYAEGPADSLADRLRRLWLEGAAGVGNGGQANSTPQLQDSGAGGGASAGWGSPAPIPPPPPPPPRPPSALQPSDADLSWLRRLARLRCASLAVPLLDFGWLPGSLEELDCLKFSDSGVTWVRCDAGGAPLPALARLALPSMGDDEEEEEGEPLRSALSDGGDDGDDVSGGDGHCRADDSPAGRGWEDAEDRTLVAISRRCPRLEDLNLVSWQPSASAAAAAALSPSLRRLALAAAEGGPRERVAAAVAAAAPGVSLDLVDPPAVYPWSTVRVL
jgi:hypothetical protein